MLPFDLSAIDLILAIAVVVLLILYITKSSAKSSTEEEPLVRKKSAAEQPATEATVAAEETRKTSTRVQPQAGSGKCPYGFGYLRKLSKEASIPDGCLSCSRMMECYIANE